MVTSYGETSGFAPVAGTELETVNGGFPIALTLAIAGTAFAVVGAYAVVKHK